MLNSNLDKLVIQLNKVKSKLKALSAITPEQSCLRPYDIDAQVSEIKKILNTPPLSEQFGETNLYKELKDFCEQEELKINKYKEEFHFGVGAKLKELFAGFADLKGQLPVLRVKFYTIQFDFTNGEVSIWWGPEKELIKKVKLEPEYIVETIKSFDDSLVKHWSNYTEFANVVKSAYHRYIKLNDLALGEKVNLLDLLTECVILMQGKSFKIDPTKSHFSEYSRIQFSYDLYRMKTTSSLMSNIQLSVATFAVTENKEKSIWVPDNEMGDGTYYQTIAFKQ